MNKTGILITHAGWTDLINSFGLISYYCSIYKKIKLIVMQDQKKLIEFYTQTIKNIEIIYTSHQLLWSAISIKPLVLSLVDKDTDILGIGTYDILRNDKFKDLFDKNENKITCFVENFYHTYDIPYINRINFFEICRDEETENKIYNNFIEKHGKNYILYHEIIENYDKNIKIINLNRTSDIFFDMIKVIENAIEIHLLDSSWACIIYLLQCKYNLFNDKKIVLYTKRDHYQMFLRPIKLKNWIIVYNTNEIKYNNSQQKNYELISSKQSNYTVEISNWYKNEEITHILNMIEKYKPYKVLEIGSKDGYISKSIYNKNIDLTCIENNVNLYKNMEQNFYTDKVKATTILGSINILSTLKDNSYDLTYTYNVMSRIPFSRSIIIMKEIVRITNGFILHIENKNYKDSELYPTEKIPNYDKHSIDYRTIYQKFGVPTISYKEQLNNDGSYTIYYLGKYGGNTLL